jgi:CDP-glycerol glycerophosphotransferase
LAAEKYIASAMKTSIGFNKPIEEFGMGRTDYLVNLDQKEIDRLKKKYNLPKNKKTVLYAPTFRDNNLENDNYELPILSLGRNKNINVIVCLHPIVAKSLKINKMPSNFYNFSGIDIIELSIISDVLITDYSSTIFDYSILEKPMIFYMYDIDEYLTYRGFYLDYKKDLPGPIVKSEKELYNLVEDIDKLSKDYEKKLKDFKKKYNYMNDGHINERIVEKIKENYFDKYL